MQWLVYNYKTRLAEWLNWLTAIFTAIIFFSCGFLDQIPAGTDWVEFLYCYYECFDIAVMIFWYLIIKPWDDSSGSLRVAFIIYWFCVFFMVNFLLCYHQLFSFLIIFVGISLTAFVYHSTATYEVYTKKKCVYVILSSATNQTQSSTAQVWSCITKLSESFALATLKKGSGPIWEQLDVFDTVRLYSSL